MKVGVSTDHKTGGVEGALAPETGTEEQGARPFNVMAGGTAGVRSASVGPGGTASVAADATLAGLEKQPIEMCEKHIMLLDDSVKKHGKKLQLTQPVNASTSKFDLCNKYFHLTYKDHHDEQEIVEFLNTLISEHEKGLCVKEYSVVNEVGKLKEEEGEAYKHCHVAIGCNRAPKKHIRSSDFFDYKGIHPHIRRCRQAHFRYLCTDYHTKDGVPYTNVDSNGEMSVAELQQMWKESKETGGNVNHALLKTMEQKGIPLAKSGPMKTALDLSKPVITRTPQAFDNLRPFQQELMNMLELEHVSDRVIGYIYDQEGAFGKSSFARYLYDIGVAFVCTTIKLNNAIEALRAHIASHGEPKFIIIDIARASNVNTGAVFNLAERFKDNTMTAGKYKSETISLTTTPHVWIFSNTEPDLSMISSDRIDLRIPSIKGHTYDYGFVGEAAKDYNDLLRKIELQKVNVAKRFGGDYTPCQPVRQQIDVSAFQQLERDMLKPEKLRTYWDRGVFPEITLRQGHKTTGPYSIYEFTEIPLTEEEKREYAASKDKEQADYQEEQERSKAAAAQEVLKKFEALYKVKMALT